MSRRLLIVDDEESVRLSLQGALRDEGFDVLTASSGEEAAKLVGEVQIDLILLDIWMPGVDGIESLMEIKKKEPGVNVIMITGHGTIETAVRTTKLGAYDFLEKPLSLDRLLLTINNALAFKELEEANVALRAEVEGREEIIGESPAILKLKEQILRVAPSEGWVLITGENGTGKELVARAIHQHSRRMKKPFVAVNCAAIPDDLIESELFGFEKGAFTGAYATKKGKLELAHEGTVLMDEIGDMSLKTQAKILRTLEERRFERLGSSQTIKVDLRIIAATNKDLGEEMRRGNFREDLFYRINVIPFHIPPLRERREDIPLFVDHFLRQFSLRSGRILKEIDENALEYLVNYHWPGNVRELKNIIERLVIMTPHRTIGPDDIPPPIGGGNMRKIPADLRGARREFETRFVLERLRENGWSITRTARAIGVGRSYLHQMVKTLKIDLGRMKGT